MIPTCFREVRSLVLFFGTLVGVSCFGQAPVADGTVRSYFTTLNTTPSIRAAALDSQGRVVAISTSNGTGAFRLNTDGSRDTGFASIGYNGALNTVLIQADGRILVGGLFALTNSVFRPYIARLNTDGSVDTTFPTTIGGTGVETLAPGSGGKFYAGKTNGYGLVRYTSDGVVDSSFLAVNIGSGQTNGKVFAVKELADGKVMVSHQLANGSGVVTGQRVERLTASGTVDTSFNAAIPNAPVHGFDVLPDGRVAIIGEFTTVGGTARVRLALLKADGTLDTSFNPGSGMEFGGFDPHFSVVSLDDRLYCCGNITSINGQTLNGLARLNLDGSVDTTFAIGSGAGTSTRVWTLMPAANGDLLAAGTFTIFNAQPVYRACFLARTVAVSDPFVAYLVAADVPANQRGELDDPDHDGISNLMEYALDLRPMHEDSASLPKVNKGQTLTLSYKHAHEDVTYRVESSASLENENSWSTDGVNQGTPAQNGMTTASVTADDAHRFLRLKVSR